MGAELEDTKINLKLPQYDSKWSQIFLNLHDELQLLPSNESTYLEFQLMKFCCH